MKKIFTITIALALLAGCREQKTQLDPPGSKLEGINAQWTLVEVEQVDVASIQQSTLDVSKAFLKNGSLDVNFNSSDFTYAVNSDIPNYLGDGGSWSFDDNEYPTKIYLIPSGSDTIKLDMLSTIRPIDTYLHVAVVRTCGPNNDPYIGYNLKFIRSN